MNMLDRILWFVNAAISLAIVAVILLMVIRLIVDGMDLNPFGWTSRTARRLSDGLLFPVRGGLRNLGMEPKFAPVVVILVTILLGYFVMLLAGTIAATVAGIWGGAQRGAVIWVIGFILSGFLSLYMLLIIIRVIFSWAMISYSNRIMRFLIDTTEPLLGPLRRLLPRLGPFDISPLVAMLIVWLFQQAVAGTLLRGVQASPF